MAFGSKARIEELERENGTLHGQVTNLQSQFAALQAENETNKQWVAYLKGLEPIQLAQQVETYKAQLAAVEQQIHQAQTRLASTERQVADERQKIVETQEVALLQEVGIYEYRHPLDDAVAYKSRLQENKASIKAMVKSGTAVSSTTEWTVNNSRQQGAIDCVNQSIRYSACSAKMAFLRKTGSSPAVCCR